MSSERPRSAVGAGSGYCCEPASKWQSSVSVSRRAGPPHDGHSHLEEVGPLEQRVALGADGEVVGQAHGELVQPQRHRPAGVAVDDRDRRAPGALARDREVGGAEALRRPRDQRRLLPAPDAGVPQRAAGRGGVGELLEDRLVGAVDGRDAEHRGRPEARVDRGRDQHGQRTRDPGGEDREARLDDRHLLELAVVALPPGVAQAVELLAHARRRRPALDLRVVGREERELGRRDGAGVGREQRRAAGRPASWRPAPRRRRGRARSAARRSRPCSRRSARRGGGRSPRRRRSRGRTTASAGRAAPARGSASTGRPRPARGRAPCCSSRTSRSSPRARR